MAGRKPESGAVTVSATRLWFGNRLFTMPRESERQARSRQRNRCPAARPGRRLSVRL